VFGVSKDSFGKLKQEFMSQTFVSGATARLIKRSSPDDRITVYSDENRSKKRRIQLVSAFDSTFLYRKVSCCTYKGYRCYYGEIH